MEYYQESAEEATKIMCDKVLPKLEKRAGEGHVGRGPVDIFSEPRPRERCGGCC